ncbi:MAG: hypothetical protein ACYC5J_14245 [Chloroflexota bacterium]
MRGGRGSGARSSPRAGPSTARGLRCRRGIYLAIVTLAFAEIVRLLLATICVVEQIKAHRPGAAPLAGLAGSIYAHYTRFISPDSFTLNESFSVLVMLVSGGWAARRGRCWGRWC